MQEINLKYSEPIIRKAIRAYWWKNVGPLFPIIALLLTVFVIYRVVEGDRSWFIGGLGTLVLISFTIMTALYFVDLRRSLNRLRRMKTPEAILELGEDRFKVISDVGSSEIKWDLITNIWRFKHVWLILFSASEFMTLPIEGISEQSKAFIVKKAEENGAKIA